MICLRDAYVRHHCNVRSCQQHKNRSFASKSVLPLSLFFFRLNICVSSCVLKSKTAENLWFEWSVKLYFAATAYDLLIINEINSLTFRNANMALKAKWRRCYKQIAGRMRDTKMKFDRSIKNPKRNHVFLH